MCILRQTTILSNPNILYDEWIGKYDVLMCTKPG